MNVIDELIEIFRKFPGVGPRQAERFVYHLLRQSKGNLDRLGLLIPSLRDKVTNCDECKRFFIKSGQEKICNICAGKNRKRDQLMIISRDTDFESIEKSGFYEGLYFILGGIIPIMEKDYEKFIRLNDLKKIIKARQISEIILALNANPEGENTEKVLKQELSEFGIKISVLGRGLSTGTELEYSDRDTIKSALLNRK